MDIPFKYAIYHRDSKFKTLSFLGNPKKNIIVDLKHNIFEKKYKQAIINAVEMNCSGWNKELFDNIISIYINNINIQNIDLLFRLTEYFSLIQYKKSKLKSKYSIELRNCKEIRNRIIDMVYLLSQSNKHNRLESFTKIKKPKDSLLHNYHQILPPSNYIHKYIYENDDEHFCQIINKLYVNIRRTDKNLDSIHTWLELLFHLESEYKKTGKIPQFHSRDIVNITDQQKQDWIWIVWKILIELSSEFPTTQKIIKSLMKLYKFDYTKGKRKKRINFIMMACILIKKPISRLRINSTHYEGKRIEFIGFGNLIYKQFANCIDDTIENNKKAKLYYLELQDISKKPPPKPKKQKAPQRPNKKTIAKQRAKEVAEKMRYLYQVVREGDSNIQRPASKKVVHEYRTITLNEAEDLENETTEEVF